MFKLNDINGIKFYTIPSFSDSHLVRHAFSTRVGGVSTGETASMNFGFNRKDTTENVMQNFALLGSVCGVDANALVMTKQVHGSSVHVATPQDIGKRIEGADALVTNDPQAAICTFYADCVPLFFLDTRRRAIGLAHSGWRSTAANIAERTIGKMAQAYGTDPSDILAAIGPSIGVCHFEVDTDVAARFDDRYVTMSDKPHIDLWRVVKDQLLAAGVKENAITSAGLCTVCHKDIFYSYRGDDGKTGSMAAVMQLTQKG